MVCYGASSDDFKIEKFMPFAFSSDIHKKCRTYVRIIRCPDIARVLNQPVLASFTCTE